MEEFPANGQNLKKKIKKKYENRIRLVGWTGRRRRTDILHRKQRTTIDRATYGSTIIDTDLLESKDDTGPRRSVIRQGYTISCNFLEYNFPQSIFFSLWYFTRTLPNSVTLTVIFSGHERGANNVFSSLLENIGRIYSLHFSALVLSKSSKKNNSTWNLWSQNSG